jgi:uncharacterized repeat protein (TIGR01451 family)
VALSPLRQIAPVGSEVILTGGVCDEDGFFRMREPLEWAISQGSVGHFVEPGMAVAGRFGLRGTFAGPAGLFTEPLPELLANNYAVGCTSKKVQVLTRGTVQTTDDVFVQEGQGWVGVTSPVEGDTYITLMAPDLDGWEQRTRTAIVHWIDGQWSFPASIVTQGIQPQTLTTTVTRRVNSLPLAGWIVRYQILDAVSALDDGTNAREVVTDDQGRASVQLVPTSPQGGSSRVQVQVIRRPPRGRELDRQIVGESTTTVTWSTSQLTIRFTGPETMELRETGNYQIEVSNPGTLAATDVLVRAMVSTGFAVASSNPPPQAFGSRLEWNLGTVAAGDRRVLDLSMQATQSGTARHCASVQAAGAVPLEDCITTEVTTDAIYIEMLGPNPDLPLPVGQEIEYQVRVTNRGDRALSDIELTDRFDEGLAHSSGASPVTWPLGPLGAGQSREVGLRFRIVAPGRLCHTLEARATGAPSARTTACVTAVEPAASPQPAEPPPSAAEPPVNGAAIVVRKTGPTQMTVGERADFFVLITNNGDTALTNLQVVDRYDPELRPQTADPRESSVSQDGIVWYISQLAPGEKQTFQVTCEALFDVRSACSRAIVRAAGGGEATDEHCLAILPATPGSGRSAPPSSDRPQLPRGATPLPGRDTSPAAAAPDAPDSGPPSEELELTIAGRGERWRIGDEVEYLITIRNGRSIPDSDVVLTIQLPQTLQIKNYYYPVTLQNRSADDRILEMAPVRTLRPGEILQCRLIAAVVAAGDVVTRAQVQSLRSPAGVTRQDASFAEARP